MVPVFIFFTIVFWSVGCYFVNDIKLYEIFPQKIQKSARIILNLPYIGFIACIIMLIIGVIMFVINVITYPIKCLILSIFK